MLVLAEAILNPEHLYPIDDLFLRMVSRSAKRKDLYTIAALRQ